MGRIRGFLLKHSVFKFFRCVRRHSRYYRRLESPLRAARVKVKPFSSLVKWTHRLRTKAKAIMGSSARADSGSGYVRVGHDPVLGKPGPIPKGHMAVYVGQKDGDFQRILVPVVYCNHPLFGDLLKESEREFGFNHPGGITIPCRISEFERIQTRIQCTRKRNHNWFLL